MNLNERIELLNRRQNDPTAYAEAESLKKKLNTWGLALTIIGSVGAVCCFLGFALGGMMSVRSFGSSSDFWIIVPWILFLPCGAVAAVGSSLRKKAKAILALPTGNAREYVGGVDMTCPNCGNEINIHMNFCAKCGKQVRLACPNCHHTNETDSLFCENCGKDLKG